MGRHLFGPLLFPLAVANLDGNRRSEGESMTNASKDGDLVSFKLHSGATTKAEPATSQLVSNLVDSDGQTRRKPLDDDDEGLAMGFTGGQITQHRSNLPAVPALPRASFPKRSIQPTSARLTRTVASVPIAKNGPNGNG